MVYRPKKWKFVGQPKKWLYGLFPLAALGLGAWSFSSPTLESSLQEAAGTQLNSGGMDWVSVDMDGRDAILTGVAPEQEAISQASKIVAETYGVRRVDVAGITVAPPVALDLPTVKKVAGKSMRPEISGTWPEGTAKTLDVSIADQTYKLGSDSQLKSDGAGNWTLTPPADLADGEYDVVAVVTDGKKAAATDNTVGEVLVDTIPPGAPTVTGKSGDAAQPKITGAYDKDSSSLAVTAAGKTYVLGTDDALTSNDAGQWTLALPNKLNPGSYDVSVTTADEFGNASSGVGQDFVSVAMPVAPKAPLAPTVVAIAGFSSTPALTGKWPEGGGNKLDVTMGGKSYGLGTDKELGSDGSGNWTLTPSDPLKDGNYDVVATATSPAGLSSRSGVENFVVLASAPAAPSVAEVAGYGNKPTVTGTWPEGNGNALSVALAGKAYQLGKDDALTSDGSGNWTLTSATELVDGNYDAVATATNVAGLRAMSNAGQVAVLTTAPALPSVDPVIGYGNTPMVTGTWPEGNGNALSVVLAGKTYDLGKDEGLKSDGSGKWSLAPESTLDDGAYDAVATVTNVAGLTTASSASKVAVLTATPAAPTAAKVEGFGNKPKLTGTWPEGGGNSLRVSVAGQDYQLGKDAELASDGSGNWSLTPLTALPEGTFNVKATVSNVAGLTARDRTIGEVQVDTVAPAKPLVANLATSQTRPTITGTWAENNADTLSVGIGGKAYDLSKTGPLTSDGKGNWSLKLDGDLKEGTHEVAVAAIDAAGNATRDGSRDEIIIDTTAPAAPTIVRQTTRERQPIVAGSWPSSDASVLSVSIGSNVYKSGESDALKVNGDNWVLDVPQKLQDGTYNVQATAMDSVGNAASDAGEGELIVDATPPATPKVMAYKSVFAKPLLTGSFPEKDAAKMLVSFGDETFTLGTGTGPVSDGNGTWAVNTEKEYAPGIYDVKVVVIDAAGNQRSDTTLNEIEILPPPAVKVAKVEPAPEPKVAINCQGLFDDLLAKDAIQFRTGKAAVDDGSASLISKLVSVVKQCPDANIEIAGHTDSRGSAEYNQKLSESRAVAVRDALKIKGAPATNITAVGYGESKPIADNSTKEGRAQNRRTIFVVKP